MIPETEFQEYQESLPGVKTGRKLLLIITALSLFEVFITVLISYSFYKNPAAFCWFLWPALFAGLWLQAKQKPFTAFTMTRAVLILNFLLNIVFAAWQTNDALDVSLGVIGLWFVANIFFVLIFYSCDESAKVVERHYRKHRPKKA
jgi:uncharacterized membrane protein YccC